MRVPRPVRVLGFFLLVLALPGCSKTHRSTPTKRPVELVVGVPTELAGPLRAALAHAPHPAKATLVASSQMAQGLAHKHPPDLLIVREGADLSRLQKSGKVVAGSFQPLLQDHLVIIGFPTSPIPIERADQLPRLDAKHPPWRGRVWVLAPSTPAGALTQSYLRSLSYKGGNVWDATATRRSIVPDVAKVETRVQRTLRGLGIVFAHDAAKMGKKVKIVLALTGKDAPRVRYDIGLVSAGHVKQARQLLDFLRAPAQLGVFAKQGWQAVVPGK